MKICLVTSPRFNAKPDRKSLAPIGLAYLAAIARQAGHDVSAVEGIFLGNPKRIAHAVAATRPDVVGTTTVTQDRLAAIETIRQIRLACPDAFLVVGGSHFTHSTIDALESVPAIDAVVMGEGEQTFNELLEHLPDRDNLGDIQGLAWRDKSGQVITNAPRPLIQDLSTLPIPAWDLFGPGAYKQSASQLASRNKASRFELVTGVMTSRGCPQQCVFCANGVPTKVRFLDPVLAVDQLQYLADHYGVTGLDILDDNFLASNDHVIALCEELLRRGCNFTWWAGARLKNLDEDVLRLMKRAGCKTINFGVETGTNEVLREIRKGITTEEMLEAMDVVARVEFERVGCCLIVGLPGETPDTLDRTMTFLRELQAQIPPANWERKTLIGQLPLIYPGTGLEQRAHQEGALPVDFSWNSPYREPKRYLPLINHRYDTIPHYYCPTFPLEDICEHLRRYYWDDLLPGRKRRYRWAPLRKLKVSLGLG
jgi:anaerobic magnesium-protoporphyrin IX monomethyl ester cyclase